MRIFALAAALALCACATTGAKITAESAVVASNLKKAHTNHATDKAGCGGKEYALAEANLEFAFAEADRGNSFRAKQHLDLALDNSSKAMRIAEATPGCKPIQVHVRSAPPPPKPVVVKLTPTDRDGDGLNDNVDNCPDDREDPDGWQDQDGCPDPDNDGDGVLDESDRCPNEPGPVENGGCPDQDSDTDTLMDRVDGCPVMPEDKDGWSDTDGCPDPDNDQDGLVDASDLCPNDFGPLETRGCPDRDLDGIGDKEDQCPGEPEDKDGFEDSNGCPDLDNDRDGLPDGRDKCPNEAGPIENQGCPDLDTDGDRVPDRVDKCPTEFGVIEEQGCPKRYSLVVVKRDMIEIKQQVHFATNKATILPDSFELLNQVSQVLKDNPNMKIRVEGHTDNVGNDSKNLRLSQARAESVSAYIKGQGVEKMRLDSIGFGETRPISSNTTAKGKAANRRVEFHIIER